MLFRTDNTIYTLPVFDSVRVKVRVRFNLQIKYSNSIIFKNLLSASWPVRELSSPRVDWPRVGLSASCPVSVVTVGLKCYYTNEVELTYQFVVSNHLSTLSLPYIVRSPIWAYIYRSINLYVPICHSRRTEELADGLLHASNIHCKHRCDYKTKSPLS